MEELVVQKIVESKYFIQFFISFLIGFIFVKQYLTLRDYTVKRKRKTSRAVMSFLDSILSGIQTDSLENITKLLTTLRGGTLTQKDCTELANIRTAVIMSLHLVIPKKFEEILIINGYYELWKENKSFDHISNPRSKELRDISKEAVDDVLRPDSPLIGKTNQRFPYQESLKLLNSVITRHCQEIDLEVKDINDESKRLLWVFYKFFRYTHKDSDEIA